MTATAEPIDLFLCHTGANKDWTRELATRLEGDRVDGRALRVFFDEWDIAPGENILIRIEDGLRRARYFAVVLSPALTRAAWPTLEWQTQVHDDPSGRRGRIIPLLVQKFDPDTLEPVDIPLPLRLLRRLDFSDPKRSEGEYQQLLSRVRGQRPRRGQADLGEVVGALGAVTGPESADPVEELLLANLFPVTGLPPNIYSDATPVTRYREIRDTITTRQRPPFFLHSNRLYSFVPPETPDSPFRQHLSGTDPRVERTESWLADPDWTPRLVWLCNDALRDRCYALRLRCPRGERHQYYPPSIDGEVRTFTWGSGRPLTLAKVSQKNGRQLGVHHSARMRFLAVGGRLNLLIEPGYFFTTEGITPVEGRQVGILSIRWGGREGNDTILRRTLMWARLLAATQLVITCPVGGAEAVRISPVPIYGRANLGLYDDASDIERILSGEGAGEVGAALTEDELDEVAMAHALGVIAPDEDEERPITLGVEEEEIQSEGDDELDPELPL